jgi:pseudaminic acid cytidylyltransferase
MTRLAIIPARAGSKRIPGKNIKFFLGKPILAYSIRAAIESNLFDEVMVSTDDDTIAQVALEYGASVPFLRSKENSGDFATTVDVLLEVLYQYNRHAKTFSEACCIYPTAPFTSPDLLHRALKTMLDGGFDSVFPVVAFSYPIQRALQLEANGKTTMIQPEFLLSRSQDLPRRFHDSGMFYWFRPQSILKDTKLFGANSGAIEISELECHDIDHPDDWALAELKYRRLAET